MGGEQILEIVWLPSIHGLVGGEGIFYFLDIGGRAEHAFALDDCGDLLKAEGVVLDGEGCVDRLDAVFPTEQRNLALPGERTETPDLAGDLRDEREDGRSDGMGRRIRDWHGAFGWWFP